MEAVGRVAGVVGWQARSYRKLWFGTVTTSFLNPIFFLVSLGVLLGKLVDESNPDLGGLSYVEFVAPALIATTAMQTAAVTTTFSVKAGLKWVRTYHAVVATPVRVVELVLGVLAWTGVRILFATTVFAAVVALAGAFESPLAVLTPFSALLCGLAFAAVLMAISAGTDSEQWLPAIFRFGIVPLFLFSGTFFPVEQLPDWLEPLAWATPLWHGVDLTRDLATGEIDAAQVAVHVGYLVTLFFVGMLVAARACDRKLLR
jgi:lipooligosaccharide transport system permease protein